jgi:hypothetical protein
VKNIQNESRFKYAVNRIYDKNWIKWQDSWDLRPFYWAGSCQRFKDVLTVRISRRRRQ